jgi:hypothetical protein
MLQYKDSRWCPERDLNRQIEDGYKVKNGSVESRTIVQKKKEKS